MALFYHLCRDYRWCCEAIVCIYVLLISTSDSTQLRIEDPVAQRPTAKIRYLGMETFDQLNGSLLTTHYHTNFGNSSYRGMYDGFELRSPNIFWGAGRGAYPVAKENTSYRLLITAGPAEPNYFGIWLASLHLDNRLEFFLRDTPVYTLNPMDVYNLIKRHSSYRRYWVNPTLLITVMKTTPWVYLNVYLEGETYDEVRFSTKAAKFESDNHAVGVWQGTVPRQSSMVAPPLTTPEPVGTKPVYSFKYSIKDGDFFTLIVQVAVFGAFGLVGAGILAGLCWRRRQAAKRSEETKTPAEDVATDESDRETHAQVDLQEWALS